MRFVRLFVNADWEPVLIAEQEVPFERMAVSQNGTALRAVDIGLFYDAEAMQGDGAACGFGAMVWEKFQTLAAEVGNEDAISALMTGNVPGLPRYIECPATLGGLANRLRRTGEGGLHPVARAWLQWMTPPAIRAGLGLQGSVAPQIAKALEGNRRGVPKDGDQPGQLMRLERAIQVRADRGLAKRTEKSRAAFKQKQDDKAALREMTAAARSAWQDMIDDIEVKHGKALAHQTRAQ